MFLKGPENLSEKLPKTIFRVSQSTLKVRASKRSCHFIPKSYGSSHARENVFGKLVGDKMAAAGALVLKRFIQ